MSSPINKIIMELGKLQNQVNMVDMKTDILFLATLSNMWGSDGQSIGMQARRMADEYKKIPPENEKEREALKKEMGSMIMESQAMIGKARGASAYLGNLLEMLMEKLKQRYPEIGKILEMKPVPEQKPVSAPPNKQGSGIDEQKD